MTIAYSYIRFSTPEQIKGDSLRRQLAASEAYAEQHGLELDTSLNMRDLGISAFRGAHRTKGALGAFLKKVETGAIPPGSVLIVEALDRLTREQVLDAYMLFLSIISAGIKVVTLMDSMEYDRDQLNIAQLIISLVMLSQANEFSVKLSRRLAETWEHKRERVAEGHKTPQRCPAWLQRQDDRYEVVEARASAIRLIFELKAAGFGSETIARKLNSMPIWHPQEHHLNRRGGWRKSYVEKILHSRSVVGEYQPHKMVNRKREPVGDLISDYYPAVVDRGLFHQVQAILASNAATPGRGGGVNGTINNLFGGITRCACGSTMTHVNKGAPPKGGQYLQCDRARRGLGCDKRMIRYDKLEPILLHYTRGFDARMLLDEAEKAREEARLHQRRQALEGELSQINQQINSYLESVGRTDGAVKRGLEAKLGERYARQAELQQDLDTISSEIRGNSIEQAAEHLANVEGLLQHMEQLEGDERSDLRRRLRSTLHQLISSIRFELGQSQSRIHVTFRHSGTLTLLLDAECAVTFCRTTTSDGRFLYQLDSDGQVVDTAPDLDQGVVEALRRRGLNPQMTATGCGRRRRRSRARAWRSPGP